MFTRRAITYALLTSLVLLAASARAASANVLIVGAAATGCPNPGYSTISAAVAAANPGDEINVCPALYSEQVVITKPLTLRGIEVNGYHRVLIQPTTFVADSTGEVSVISVLNTMNVSD